MRNIYRKYEEKIWYVIAGGWNTLIGYLVFAILYYFLSHKIHYLIILVFSYIVSITNAYVSYKYLVFKTKGNYLREYLRFYLVYGTSFLVNIALMMVIVELIHINPVIAQGIILFFTTMIAYVGHKRYSFNISTNES